MEATNQAIDNPLLEGVSIKGAKSILLNIIADTKFKISDLKKMTEQIKQTAGDYGKLIWGVVTDERMEDEIIVTIIATGFSAVQQRVNTNGERETSKNLLLDDKDIHITKIPTTSKELSHYDIPTVQRRDLLRDDELSKIRANDDLDNDYNNDDIKISNDDKPAFLRRQMD
jgi:cell division protein FtsZ